MFYQKSRKNCLWTIYIKNGVRVRLFVEQGNVAWEGLAHAGICLGAFVYLPNLQEVYYGYLCQKHRSARGQR